MSYTTLDSFSSNQTQGAAKISNGGDRACCFAETCKSNFSAYLHAHTTSSALHSILPHALLHKPHNPPRHISNMPPPHIKMRFTRMHHHLKRQPPTLQRPPKPHRLAHRHPNIFLPMQYQHRRESSPLRPPPLRTPRVRSHAYSPRRSSRSTTAPSPSSTVGT